MKKSQGKMRNYLPLTENKNTIQENVWDAAVLKGKLITLNTYSGKEEISQITDLKLRKEKMKPKGSRKME